VNRKNKEARDAKIYYELHAYRAGAYDNLDGLDGFQFMDVDPTYDREDLYPTEREVEDLLGVPEDVDYEDLCDGIAP